MFARYEGLGARLASGVACGRPTRHAMDHRPTDCRQRARCRTRIHAPSWRERQDRVAGEAQGQAGQARTRAAPETARHRADRRCPPGWEAQSRNVHDVVQNNHAFAMVVQIDEDHQHPDRRKTRGSAWQVGRCNRRLSAPGADATGDGDDALPALSSADSACERFPRRRMRANQRRPTTTSVAGSPNASRTCSVCKPMPMNSWCWPSAGRPNARLFGTKAPAALLSAMIMMTH